MVAGRVLGVLLSAALLAPLGASDSPRPFRSGVDLVTLDVCVRDANGRFLPTLAADDFVVLENGTPQRVTFLTPAEALPLRVVLLIDSSASMYGPKMTRALDAARQFANLLGPEDQLEIITFNDRASIPFPFGTDRAHISSALTSIDATGMTALNEALLVTASELGRVGRENGRELREVVVVLSDGEDTSSVVGFDEVLTALRRSGALVYAVSLRATLSGEWLGANWPLLKLAADTGGRALGVPRLEALPALYREIDTEVRNLYRIGYVSSDAQHDGKWRPIAVRLRSGDARIQTRSGYYAPRK